MSISKAYTLAVCACFIWAGNFIIARAAHHNIPPVSLAFWRWMFALAAATPFALPHLRAQWPLIRANAVRLLLMGCVGIGGFNTLVYIAAYSTQAQNLALIAATSPLWIIVLSVFLKHEKLNAKKYCGVALAFMGTLFVVSRGSLSTLLSLTFAPGDILLFIAAWIWAIYSILLKKIPAQMNIHVLLFVQVLLGVLTLLPFYIWEHHTQTFQLWTLHNIVMFSYLGVGASFISFKFWSQALLRLGAPKVGFVYYLIPVFSGVEALIFLGERIYWFHAASFLCIVSGILLFQKQKS